MTTKKQTSVTFNIALAGIELVSSYINEVEKSTSLDNNFVFNIEVLSKVTPEKVIVVKVIIDAFDTTSNQKLGGVAVNCLFFLENFDEHVKQSVDGKSELPINLVDILNSLSISTTRGILFSAFKGTYLQNIILPIIDPKTLAKR